MPNWSRLICGGAGWKVNGTRRALIDEVKLNLEYWRDFDDPKYLIEAKRLLEEAS